MNITKLNFTDKEYSSLVNSYLKILIYAVNIDNSIDRKEISVLFSLFTRTEIEGDNSFFIKLNYFKKLHSLNSDFIHIDEGHFDYLRVLELENLIFYEGEKSLHLILSYLSKHKKDKLSFNDKMEKLDNYLEIIKEIIESKRKQLGDNYVEVFYFGILFYVEIIAMQTGKFLGKKIVEEEKKYIERIKDTLDIKDKEIKNSLIEKLRTPILDI